MTELNPFNLILIGLATWRLSSLLVNEAGPFNMFDRIRMFFGVKYYFVDYTEEKKRVIYLDIVTIEKFDGRDFNREHKSQISKLFSCVWCISVFVSYFLVFLLVVSPDLFHVFTFWLSASAVAIAFESFFNDQ